MKKLVSLLLVLTLVLSLAACGKDTTPTTTTAGNDATTAAEETTKAEVVKPEKLTIMADGTIVKEDDDAKAFYDQLSEVLGIELTFIRPDHSGYAKSVSTTFMTGTDLPDVVLLPAAEYATYASLGYLWNMTDAWENSELKASDRVVDGMEACFESNIVVGEDGEMGLYGFAPAANNPGCVTYIKKTWMDAAGVTELPKTYAEYYDMLLKMKEAKGASPIVASGICSKEAPYINYLPEFYQDAYPDFYEKNGEWVDGFTQPEMKAALERLTQAWKDGLFDGEIVTNSTADARNKFYADKAGIFTYWCGTWRFTLMDHCRNQEGDYPGHETEEIVMLSPIAEVGQYLYRKLPVWAITTECENPEGAFKYFLETMLDGGEAQMLWEYGAKDVHYSYDGTEFKMLPLASTGKPGSKNHFDGIQKFAEYRADFNDGKDVGMKTVSPEAIESSELFLSNYKHAPAMKKTEEATEYQSKVMTERLNLIAQIVAGEISYDDAMAEYAKECGEEVELILDSFNK